MNNSALIMFFQVIMITGLLMIASLLVMPVVSGLFGSAKLTENRSVLEISDNLNSTRRMIVNRAKNMLESNPDAKIEVVAWSNGVELLSTGSTQKHAVQSLIDQGVIFTACQNSVQRLDEESATPTELLAGVRLVQDGRRYAEQLKDDGYIDELA